MSELEPTRTYSNPTATEILRRMLDERGVEWTSGRTEVSRNIYTDFFPDAGMSVGVWESRDGKLAIDAHTDYHLTPEQAIAATLGSCNCPDNCTNSERTETCNADETDTWECVRDDLGGYGKTLTVHVMECTECGHTYEHVNGDYEFCPRCGRKRRDVEE